MRTMVVHYDAVRALLLNDAMQEGYMVLVPHQPEQPHLDIQLLPRDDVKIYLYRAMTACIFVLSLHQIGSTLYTTP